MSKLIGTVRVLPGLVVGTSLRAARLPLDVAARVSGQAGNDEWPPALAYETAEAAVETTVGSWLRDDGLVSRGRLRQARLTKLREAARLEAVAEKTRATADDELEERRGAAERRRGRAERSAEQREEQIEQQAKTRKQSAKKAASTRAAAVAKQAEATEEALDRQERDGKLAAADAEREAIATERAALAAEDRALAADAAIEASREARAQN